MENSNKEKKLISLQDGILVLGILFLAIVGLLILKLSQKTGYQVEISIDGNVVETLSLDKDTVYEIKQEVGNNKVVIVDGEVSVTEADCPDKICQKHTPISKVGETIICLPHKVVVEVVE